MAHPHRFFRVAGASMDAPDRWPLVDGVIIRGRPEVRRARAEAARAEEKKRKAAARVVAKERQVALAGVTGLPADLKTQELAAVVAYMRGMSKAEAFRAAKYTAKSPAAVYALFNKPAVKATIRAFTEASFKCGVVSREGWLGEQEALIQRAAEAGAWGAVATMRSKLAEVCGLTGARGVEVGGSARFSDLDLVAQLRRLVGVEIADRVAIELGLKVIEGRAERKGGEDGGAAAEDDDH